ncbi:MAG: hypothetical protein V2A58_10395 [Planctomycetota bacterium]
MRTKLLILAAALLVGCCTWAEEDPNLLPNGSFEDWTPGRPALPLGWCFRPWARDDRAELVTDPLGAHSGLRYVRLGSLEGRMKFDALPCGKGLTLTSGQTYDITVWAKADPESPQAELLVEPGRHRAQLTFEWAKYDFSWTHPEGAAPLLGFYVACKGGGIAVDDVSMTPGGVTPRWSASVAADRRALTGLPVTLEWRAREGDRPWPVRLPVIVSEVMGIAAKNHLVMLKVSDLAAAYSYVGLAVSAPVVVDASPTPAPVVPSQLVDSHPRIKGVSPGTASAS